jgi:hypothetical protein
MTGKNANMHKLWIRNTNKDNKVYDEDKEWQIVTRSVVSKSITGYNFAAKHGALTNSGHNELAISRTESPDMNKNEYPLFCNLPSRERTHAVLVIGLYALLGNPTIQLIEPPGSRSGWKLPLSPVVLFRDLRI